MSDWLFLHEQQLAEIDGKISGVREEAVEAAVTAGHAVETAGNALMKAGSAQATAQDAKQRAQNAEELARTAGAKADNAIRTATGASETAAAAEQIATGASQTAAAADETATEALEGLSSKADRSDLPSLATDDIAGLVKLNTGMNIYLDENGNLIIGGRLGQFPGKTGLYAPDDRQPRAVGDFDLLITDALGMIMESSRSLAIVSGYALNVRSAEPGTTVYYAENNYINRIIAKVCEDGTVSKDEETSKVEMTIPVTSVLINGKKFEPDSTPDDPDNPIVITLEETANPETTITRLRMFGRLAGYASSYIGNGIRISGSGGRSLLLGGVLVKMGGNDHCMIGQIMFAKGNGNVMLGRNHIATKNRGFFHGTGHDGRNAKSESVAAFGDWSEIDSTTALCYGGGTSATNRKNIFELITDGRLKLSGTPSEDDDVITKRFADANYGGSIPITTYGNADFTYEQVIDPDTGTVINECVAYSTSAGSANEPTATKYGRIVNLAGAFKNINARPDNSAFDMGKVPTGCEPLKTQYILEQGTSQYKFMMTIRTDGTINCSRYSAGASAVAVPNNAWLNINATYISAS